MLRLQNDLAVARALALTAIVSLGLLGCSGDTSKSPEPGDSPATTTSGGTGTGKSRKSSQTEDLMRSILSMMRLESLGITAQEDDLVGLINQWQRFNEGKQLLDEEVALDGSVLEAWREKLTERQVKEVRRYAFQRSDIERLRSLLLMNAVARQIAQGGQNDLARVRLIFENINRNTELVANHPDEIPLSPYQIYLLGRATPADRAWLFAEMLRQLKIDAFILTSKVPTEEAPWDATQPFLIGVLLEKQVYLFDPQLGFPLTIPGTNPPELATLETARRNPEVLKQYAISDSKPYRITADFLQSPVALIIGDTALWSYRFRNLQSAFTGAHAMVISESPVDLEAGQGQMTRIVDSGTLGTDGSQVASRVAIWDYPDAQLNGQVSLSAQHEQTLSLLTDVWKTPVEAESVKQPDRPTPINVPRATNLFLFARLDHAQGKLEDAVKGYTRVRVQLKQRPELTQITERLVYAYVAAEEDSLYWIGICKLDQNTPDSQRVAIDKMEQYLAVQPKGRWIDHVRYLLAQAYLTNEQPERAIEQLRLISADHPQQSGIQFLIRTHGGGTSPATTPTPTPAPTDTTSESNPETSPVENPTESPGTTESPSEMPTEVPSETPSTTPPEPPKPTEVEPAESVPAEPVPGAPAAADETPAQESSAADTGTTESLPGE